MSELGGNDTGTGTGGANGGGEKRGGVGANGAGEYQKDKERTIAKAALSIAELGSLLDGPDGGDSEETHAPPDGESSSSMSTNSSPLRSVHAAAAYIPFTTDSRKKVREEMEALVLQGLTSLDQSLLASSLQTAYNLRTLPTLVAGLVRDLSEAVEERIRNAFDLSRISKEIVANEAAQASQGLLYKSRVRTEPTNVTAPQFAAALWVRIESLVEEMAGCCIKYYILDVFRQVFGQACTRRRQRIEFPAPNSELWLSQAPTAFSRVLSLGRPISIDPTKSRNDSLAPCSCNLRSPPCFSRKRRKRTVTNELYSARSDPLLVRVVAKSAATSLESVVTRADGPIVFDRSAVSLLGPMATPQQLLNGQVATCLYCCWTKLVKLMEEHTESELAGIMARLHRLDLRKTNDPKSGMLGTSLYMKDLVDKLNFVKTGLLSNFAPETVRPWLPGIVKYVIRMFVMHASIAKPLGECGKLQLTTDMAELEFSLNAFLADGSQSKRSGSLESIGEEYKALRAMGPLLFLENAHLASPERTARRAAPHPRPVTVATLHTLHGWQEAEYVRWVDEHAPEEALSLIDGCISHWEKRDRHGQEDEMGVEYIGLARAVLGSVQRVS
ncbi:hypothetical protein EV363DRAFT_1447546 [Boletus edulis]|nr:hypothetical protein EV363DRAFT_1447546 [Boletus edulis]